MRYSYEFKRKCVEMYRQGQYPETPDNLSDTYFHDVVRKWVRIEDARGPDALRHRNSNKIWSPEDKLTLVSQVIAGKSNRSVAFENGISNGLLCQWVRKYKTLGYNGLVNKKRGRLPKDPDMKKVNYIILVN